MTRALPLILVVTAAALLRSVNLGYSHFQGDELNALFPPDAGFADFLLGQRKGPGQFLVTRMMHGLVGGYDELTTRVPFTVASVAGVAIVAAFVRSHWGPHAALLAAALMASCGLILAFGRIVQYQAFSMLLILITAWSAFTFARNGEIKWLYVAAATLGVGVLFHYDPVTFVPTFCLLVAVRLWRETRRLRLTAHLAGAALVTIAITATFFVPYVLQPDFAEVTEYLRRRVAGGTVAVTFRLVRDLLALYLPPFYFTIIGPAWVAGVIGLLRRGDLASYALLVWFASTFSFYMLLGGDPRSHVYTIFIPGLIIAAYGLLQAIELADRVRLGSAVRAAVWTVLVAFGWAAWMMFVDHRAEHPWYAKSLLGYRLPNLEEGRIEGVFGFPYQRGLDSVGVLFDRGELAGTFDSNERISMADYYFHSRRGGEAADYYVYVHRPLSLERSVRSDVKDHYVWLRQIVVNGRKTIDVYERVSPGRPLPDQGF
jgi:hypothetical protein